MHTTDTTSTPQNSDPAEVTQEDAATFRAAWDAAHAAGRRSGRDYAGVSAVLARRGIAERASGQDEQAFVDGSAATRTAGTDWVANGLLVVLARRAFPTPAADRERDERVRDIRERATARVTPTCASCHTDIVPTAPTRVSPPSSGTYQAAYTDWTHTDTRGVWCDRPSLSYARPTNDPGNPDALWLLDELDRRTTQATTQAATIRAVSDVLAANRAPLISPVLIRDALLGRRGTE